MEKRLPDSSPPIWCFESTTPVMKNVSAGENRSRTLWLAHHGPATGSDVAADRAGSVGLSRRHMVGPAGLEQDGQYWVANMLNMNRFSHTVTCLEETPHPTKEIMAMPS